MIQFDDGSIAPINTGRTVRSDTLQNVGELLAAVAATIKHKESPQNNPCPFCGGNTTRTKGRTVSQQIECASCGAEGPQSETPLEAWNRRT